ncbi:MAG: EamA family transporter [Chitinophagales bacterium]
MIALILCIACTSLLVFMFKVFEHFKIDVFPAIVFNYLTCVICGFIDSGTSAVALTQQSAHSNWFWLAIVMGFSFINIFSLTSETALLLGVSTASVAMKLGLVIPVFLAFAFYGEPLTGLKIIGILLAVVAVVLSSIKEQEHAHQKRTTWTTILPIIVFVGSGLCDSGAQLGEKKYFPHGGSQPFVLFIFLFAFVTGTIYLIYSLAKGKVQLRWNQVVGGIALGIPNYGSLLFLLRALNEVKGGSSVVFPISNIAAVAGSTLLSILFFKERLSRLNWLGMLAALGCIAVMAVASN